MMIELDAPSHIYSKDGKRIDPSNTGLLKAEGFIDDTWFTEYGRERGRIVHKACDLDDIGDLDDDSIDPVILPYLEAYRKFKTETQFRVEATEEIVYSPTYGFVGTLDKRGRFPKEALPAILDIKSGALQPWVALQLAGYEIAVGTPHNRYGLELRENGTYRLEPFTDRSDRGVFLGALACYRWKKNHRRRNDGTGNETD